MAASPAHMQQQYPQAPVALQDIEMQFDWPSITLDTPWEPLPELTPDLTPELPHGPDSAASSSGQTEPPEDLRTSIVRRLSKLASEFDKVYSGASTEELRHVPNDEFIREIATKWGKEHNQQKILEQLFAFTQQLIDIYPEAMKQIFREREKVDCQDPGCIHHEPLPAEYVDALNLDEDDGAALEDIDHSLFDHLHLCHSRLNDVLGALLLRLKMCNAITTRHPVLEESDFDVPTLTVGNVVISAHSATSMQAVLIVHIASSLVLRARKLGEKMTLATQQVKTSKARLLGLRCDILVEESESRLKLLKIARDHMSELLYDQ